jgi:type IV pilus assembly protein PilB
MVGEIRDAETAEIAIRAAITGHLVLSTVHTNDALSTVVRLTDMGIEPYLVASSVKCVVSQRLVKKICPHCKAKSEVSIEQNRLLQSKITHSFVGKGCQQCKFTGYLGRQPVHEVLVVDGAFEELITRKASMEELRAQAKSRGMRMLKDELTDLIEQGSTTVEEGLRILYSVD